MCIMYKNCDLRTNQFFVILMCYKTIKELPEDAVEKRRNASALYLKYNWLTNSVQ
jgi:hypothetical protein